MHEISGCVPSRKSEYPLFLLFRMTFDGKLRPYSGEDSLLVIGV